MVTQESTIREVVHVPIKMLTAEQVAEMYQVSKKTVYRWAKQGAIPAFREGRVVRFSQRDIARHISRSTSGEK